MFGRRRSEARSITIPPGTLGEVPAGARAVSTDAALRISTVYACVRVLSDSAASLPLIAYRRSDRGRVRAGGRLQDLIDRPSPATTTASLIGTVVAHLSLHGNAYLAKLREVGGGRVEQLVPLDPRRVIVEIVGSEPRYKVTAPGGRQSTHGVEDVLHVKALSTDGIYGMSPIRQCAVALRVAQGHGDFVDAFLAQGARMSGVLKVGDGTKREATNEISEALTAQHSGVRKMHRIAVVGGGADVTWTPMTASLQDLELVEHNRMSVAEICRIFRVPPWMVGAPSGDSLTYSNTENQTLAFAQHSLRPTLVTVEQAITADADLCRGPSVYVEFLVDALLRADSKTRAEIYALALDPDKGWMDRDEVRRAENLGPQQGEST